MFNLTYLPNFRPWVLLSTKMVLEMVKADVSAATAATAREQGFHLCKVTDK